MKTSSRKLTSMFQRILVVYIAVMVGAFAILSVVVHIEVRHFLAEQRLTVLQHEANALLPYLDHYGSSPYHNGHFTRLLTRFKQQDDASINLLLLGKGNELRKVHKLAQELTHQRDLVNGQAVNRVLNGQRVELIGPFIQFNRESMLTVGVPIRTDGLITGALFLHTPVQNLESGQVTQILLLIAIPVLVLSIAVLYVFTRRFSNPLMEMSKAVRAIGRGDFNQKIVVRGQDEVAYLAETFNQMVVQLRALEDMRKDLIANVSHEIRNPLTSVRGFVQGILDGVIPPSKERQYLEAANRELARLGHILSSMLDLAALETGKISVDARPVLWSQVVSQAANSVRVRAEEKGLQFIIDVPAVSVWLLGDFSRLTQIVFNLLDNAIRHTSTGQVGLSSEVSEYRLVVRVYDTGEGISESVLPHIWERFFTTSNRREAEQSRTGLGLTITKHLVERLHGSIQVASKEGEGTVFTLIFPIFSTAEADIDDGSSLRLDSI